MTRAVRSVLAIALAVPALAAPVRAQQAKTPEVEEFTAAGIPVVYQRIDANQVIAVRLYLKGGSAALTPETQGIENLMTAAATRGTEEYTRDEFAEKEAANGVRISTEAFPDYTAISLQAVRDRFDAGWDLFTQAVLHPTFPPEEVALARDRIVNQLKARRDDPDAYLAVLANREMYAGHPYALDPAGTPETVGALTAADLKKWHDRRLTKENLVFVVVGNVSREDVKARIEAAFAGLPATGGAAGAVPPVGASTPEVQVTERDLPTNYVRGEFAAPAPGDPDYAAARIALDVLSDRLFEEVRTKRNLSYAVYAVLSQRKANYGLLYVTAVQPDTTLEVMLQQVARLKDEPIPAHRLAEAVNVFLTRYWMGQETNMGRAATLGTFEVVGGGWRNADAFVHGVEALGPGDVREAARAWLKGLHFVVIGDPAAIDHALFTSL